MYLKSVGKGRVRCTNPEQYKILRTCKVIEQEVSPILAALTTLFVKASESDVGRLKDMLRCCHSPHAPRFLRQAIPCLRSIEVRLQSDNFAMLSSNLSPFVQLREVRISAGRSMTDCIPDSIAECPLLLLGTASDKLFVMTLKRCLKKVMLDMSNLVCIGTDFVSCKIPAFKAMVNEPIDELHKNADPITPYALLWEGESYWYLKHSVWQPLALVHGRRHQGGMLTMVNSSLKPKIMDHIE